MANKRIYQIAKELNISHNEIIKFLRDKFSYYDQKNYDI